MPKLSEFITISSTTLTNTIVPVIEIGQSSDNRNKNILLSDLKSLLLTKASNANLGAVKVGSSLTINNDGVLDVIVPIPSQANNSGKYLTTDNVNLRWEPLPQDDIDGGNAFTT
jgi:hypothetical protein